MGAMYHFALHATVEEYTMATNLIRLADGTLIEVEARENEPQQISSDQARRVQETLERVKPMLINACKPLVAAWDELS